MPPTADERETIEDVIEARDAETVGVWERVDPDPALASFDNEMLVQWEDPGERIAVTVERGEHRVGDREGDPYYDAGATSIGEFTAFTNKSLASREDTLATALDAAIDYLDRTDPTTTLPVFSLRMEGGLVKPLMEFVDRLGGRQARFTVRDDGVRVQSMGFNSGVDFLIPAADMAEYDVERTGAFTVDTDSLWKPFKNIRFGDVVPVALDGTEDSPRLGISTFSTLIGISADYTERPFPDPAPPDLRFTVGGLSFRDAMRVARVGDFETAALGIQSGVVLLHAEEEDAAETFTMRLDATGVVGDGFVTVGLGSFQEFRRALPRPSQNDVAFTIKFGTPLLAETTVGDSNVDVRMVLADEAVPVDIEIPPAVITVPDETVADVAEVPIEEMEKLIADARALEDDLDRAGLRSVENEVNVARRRAEDALDAVRDVPVETVDLDDVDAAVEQLRELRGAVADAETALDAAAGEEPEVETVTVVSPNRPLTRAARRDLEGAGIVSVEHPRERGRQSVVETRERPTPDVIDQHELVIEEDPVETWTTDVGATIMLFPDKVLRDRVELDRDPADVAAELREMHRDDPDAVTPVDVDEDTPFGPIEAPEGEPEDEEPIIDEERRAFVERLNEEFGLDKDPHQTVLLQDLPGIGRGTQEKLGPRGLPDTVSIAQTAFEMRDEREGWIELLDVLPSDDARRTLIRAIGEDPDEIMADEPPSDLTRSEIETIVEGATVGVTANAVMMAGDLREIRLTVDPDADVSFTRDVEEITAVSGDGAESGIMEALERWEEFVEFDSLSDAQVTDVNEARGALSEQFGIDIPSFIPVEAGGFTALEIEELVERGTAGLIATARIRPDIDSLRIALEPDPRVTIEYEEEMLEVQGAASDPVSVVNDALAAWEDAVDMDTVGRLDVERERERLEDEYGVDLLELGDTPPEPDAEPGEEPDVDLTGEWADVRQVAIDQSVPLEDRELRIAERLEPKLFDEYPDAFDDFIVGLSFPPGGTPAGQSVADVLEISFGADPAPGQSQRFVLPPVVSRIEATGTVNDPEAVWQDLMRLIVLLDTENPEFSEITEAFERVIRTSEFRIEEGRVDLDDIVLHPDTIRPVASRNIHLWTAYLTHMSDTSNAWWAAQRVTECAEGLQEVCDLIEQEIAGTTRRGYKEWYLQHAYEIYLDSDFDATRFIREWHTVFRPGETEADARDRRGPIDLETLGRVDGEPREPTPAVEEPEPEREPEREPADARERLSVSVSEQVAVVDAGSVRPWHTKVERVGTGQVRVKFLRVSVERAGAAGPGGDMAHWGFNVIDGEPVPVGDADPPPVVVAMAAEALEEYLAENPDARQFAFQEHALEPEPTPAVDVAAIVERELQELAQPQYRIDTVLDELPRDPSDADVRAALDAGIAGVFPESSEQQVLDAVAAARDQPAAAEPGEPAEGETMTDLRARIRDRARED